MWIKLSALVKVRNYKLQQPSWPLGGAVHFVMAEVQGGEKRGGDGGVRKSTRFDELEMFQRVVQKNWGMLRKRAETTNGLIRKVAVM